MTVKTVPIVIGALGTSLQGIKKESKRIRNREHYWRVVEDCTLAVFKDLEKSP